jgi:hypothetical protein
MTALQSRPPWPFLFDMGPTSSRKHGPKGYADYSGFKDWLRDEFSFRCMYCLAREQWERDPRSSFGVEHLTPQSTDQSKALDYDNLAYACNSCNSARRQCPLPTEFLNSTMGDHVRLEGDGRYVHATEIGRSMIDLLKLNLPFFVEARRRILFAYGRTIGQYGGVQGADFDLFRFPGDLPDLSALRPPNGNDRPAGLGESAFRRRSEGRLPDFY